MRNTLYQGVTLDPTLGQVECFRRLAKLARYSSLDPKYKVMQSSAFGMTNLNPRDKMPSMALAHNP